MNIKESIYQYSPCWMQNYFCSLVGQKQIGERFNDVFVERLERLNRTQYESASTIRSYKEEHIYDILRYVYNNVPFYKRSFMKQHLSYRDFKGINDLEKFPVLTKEDVRVNYKELVSLGYNSKKLIHSHTSGSSGKALDFFLTKDSIPYQWAVWWRFRNRFGVRWGDKHLNCTGKLIVPINVSRPPYWRINKPMNQWLINMQHLCLDKIKSIADMIDREQFVYISGYPSIIYALSSLIVEAGIQVKNPPRFIFSGAEKMYDNQKNIIQQAFPGIFITDHYGTSEGVINASKCKFGCYHEDYEFGHMECEDPTYISKSEFRGELLGTGYSNLGMPFIRYRIGDSAIFSLESCSCGLQSMVIKDIEGRSEDYVLTPEGTRIKRFDYLFKDTVEIRECQVVQRNLGEIVFRIVRRDNYRINAETRIKNDVMRMISPSIKVSFEYVDEISRTSNGKFKAVVSELK